MKRHTGGLAKAIQKLFKRTAAAGDKHPTIGQLTLTLIPTLIGASNNRSVGTSKKEIHTDATGF